MRDSNVDNTNSNSVKKVTANNKSRPGMERMGEWLPGPVGGQANISHHQWTGSLSQRDSTVQQKQADELDKMLDQRGILAAQHVELVDGRSAQTFRILHRLPTCDS